MEEAIYKDDISVLRKLVGKGYDINRAARQTHGDHEHIYFTPLSLAIRWHHEDLVYYLLSQNADVNATNSDGSTALFYSLQKGDFAGKVTSLLLDKGANPNIKADDGMTPLIYARNGRLTQITKLLLKRGAKDPFEEAVMWVPQIQVEANGRKSLLYGISHGDRTTNSLLIAAGNGDLDAARNLLRVGADTNLGDINMWGNTPLSIAVLRNHGSMVAYLLEHGANINGRNRNGTTPLMLAVANEEGDVDMVKLLIANGADLSLRDFEGNSALDYATLGKNTNAVVLLKQTLHLER